MAVGAKKYFGFALGASALVLGFARSGSGYGRGEFLEKCLGTVEKKVLRDVL